MKHSRYHQVFFVSLLLGILYLFLCIAKPFLMIFIWAAIVVVTLYPFYEKCLRFFRGRKFLAAMSMMAFLLGIIIVPLAGIIAMLAKQASDVYVRIQSEGMPPKVVEWWNSPQITHLRKVLNLDDDTLMAAARDSFQFVATQSSYLIATLAQSLFQFALFLLVTYYFFKFGDVLVVELKRLSPLPVDKEDLILGRIAAVIRATMQGTFVTLLIHGVWGGLGIYLIGFPSPVMWGSLMALASLTPVLGSTVLWIPWVIYLFLAGHTFQAVFLLVWAALVVGLADNVIKPMIIQGKTKMHSVIILFSLMGGLSYFGFAGFILGPLTAALTFVFLDIYRDIFREDLM